MPSPECGTQDIRPESYKRQRSRHSRSSNDFNYDGRYGFHLSERSDDPTGAGACYITFFHYVFNLARGGTKQPIKYY